MSIHSTAAATSGPRPKGHIWSVPLNSWVVPIKRRNSRRPSPDHIFCSQPPCWVLIEPLSPESSTH